MKNNLAKIKSITLAIRSRVDTLLKLGLFGASISTLGLMFSYWSLQENRQPFPIEESFTFNVKRGVVSLSKSRTKLPIFAEVYACVSGMGYSHLFDSQYPKQQFEHKAKFSDGFIERLDEFSGVPVTLVAIISSDSDIWTYIEVKDIEQSLTIGQKVVRDEIRHCKDAEI